MKHKDLHAEGNIQGKQISDTLYISKLIDYLFRLYRHDEIYHNTEKVCSVALDYVGLSTSSNDLYEFLK